MAKVSAKILIIDDDEDVLLTARMVLKRHFETVRSCNDPELVKNYLQTGPYDVVLLDMNLSAGSISGKEGLDWLSYIHKNSPVTSVVMMTAYGEIELAVKAMKEGAVDFVVKPWDNDKLISTVSAAHKQSLSSPQRKKKSTDKGGETKAAPSPKRKTSQTIIGESEVMQKVFSTIKKVGRTDVNVLILGENGTGKEVIARGLHEASPRKGKVFVNVDLGAIPETLFESELFGHKKGAFTDAHEDRDGRFVSASGGTLFLDEIGNLSLPLQAKLLAALQSREVVPVGSNKPVPVDIRLICATNMPLYEMVQQNDFRQDLLYRINTVEMRLPPLRDRRDDIPLLVEHYLRIYEEKYGQEGISLAPLTHEKLRVYHWPGNIRELQHALERAVIMAESSQLQPTDFSLHTIPSAPLTDEKKEVVSLEESEKEAIRAAIMRHNGNMSKAARELGIGRTTLYRKMTKYGL